MEVPNLDFFKKEFDENDQFSNDNRVWEKIHSTFPKTLDRIDHDINFEDISDEKLLSVIRHSMKEDSQMCKPRNLIKSNVSGKRKHLY